MSPILLRLSSRILRHRCSRPPGFLIVWQQDRLGRSNLEPRIPKGTPRRERFRLLLNAPMTGFEYNLIAANAIIVAGSSIMTGAIKNPDGPKAHRQETTGKAMRAFGLAVLVGMCVFRADPILPPRQASLGLPTLSPSSRSSRSSGTYRTGNAATAHSS